MAKIKEVKVMAVAFPDIFRVGGAETQEKVIEDIIMKYLEDEWTLDKMCGGYSQLLLVFTK